MVTVGAWDGTDKALLTPSAARERYGHLAALYTAGGLGRHTTFERMKVPTVTTLTGWLEVCSLQTWFKANFPVLEESSSLYVRLRGTIYHSALAAGPGAQEVPLFDRTHSGTLWGGFIDGYDEETGILYETKTTRPDRRTGRMRTEDLPKLEHSLQVRFYAHLLAEHGFPVKEMLITYFTFDEYRTFRVKDPPLTERFVEATVEGTTDAMSRPQGGYRAKWACSYCPFYRYCPVGYPYLVNEYLKPRTAGYPEMLPAVEPAVLSVSHLSEIARKRGNSWAVDLLQHLPSKDPVPVLTWAELKKRGQTTNEMPFTTVPAESLPPPTEG